jgi:hypothetical protein
MRFSFILFWIIEGFLSLVIDVKYLQGEIIMKQKNTGIKRYLILIGLSAFLFCMCFHFNDNGLGKIGNFQETCSSNDTCVYEGTGNFSITAEGNDLIICKGTGNFTIDCKKGGCRIQNQSTGNCIVSCPAGNCTLNCTGTGNCLFTDCSSCKVY